MTPEIGKQTCTAFNSERDALRVFVDILLREQNALIENVSDELLKVAELKSTHALTLNKLVEARHSLFQANLPALSASAVQIWLQTELPQCLPVWQEIVALTEQARQLNTTSGELIQLKLRHNQQALSVLTNANNKASLYGPSGHPSFNTDSSKPITSV